MSFSGTPLGQGRRLDHQTFLNGGHPPPSSYAQSTNSPPRRAPNTASIPLSYAYGAPTLENRSPARPPVSPRSQRNASPSRSITSHRPRDADNEDEQEEEERALARYARLKQRNQVLANRPGYSKGPGIITSPPKPTASSLKDTSVNIASAFHQAADSFASMSSNSRAHVPRSTSVEYEQETQSSSHRRLAAPPSRTGGRAAKPPSRAGMSSIPENERSDEAISMNGRAKSPFDHLTDLAQRAMSPATFLLRQRSQEPEGSSAPSRQATEATLVNHPSNNSNSYDFADEEAEYQRSVRGEGRNVANSNAAQKRSRISADNQAYQPTVSDLEQSEEEDADAKRSRKRKSKKKDSIGGPLTTLPVVSYDKRRKRRTRAGKEAGQEGDEEDTSISDNQISEQHSLRSPTPTQYRASGTRGSVPPPIRASVSRDSVPPELSSFERSGPTDTSMDLEQGLESIPEFEEVDVQNPPDAKQSVGIANFPASSSSSSRPRPSTKWGIGTLLGLVVNFIYHVGRGLVVFLFRAFAIFTLLVGRLLGSIFDLLVTKPLGLLRKVHRLPVVAVGKYVIVAIGMYMAWYALRHPTIAEWSGFPSPHVNSYRPSDVPPGTIDELASRLVKAESTLVTLQASTSGTQGRLENDLRKLRDLPGRVTQGETRLDTEVARIRKSEEELKSTASKDIEKLGREVYLLSNRLEDFRAEGSGLDEEAKAKVRMLEERIDEVESGVKDALELSRYVKAGASTAAGIIPAWWNKLDAGAGSALTIKTTDGHDITSLIGYLVDNAVSRYMKDGLALVDYALYSGGAAVIPSLTSRTWESKPSTGWFRSWFTRQDVLYGRPPVTALHHENHLGHCWPIEGSQGRLGVKLAVPVYISGITIDHVAKETAHDMRSAPRQMELWGLVEGADNEVRYKEYLQLREQAKQDALENGLTFEDESEPFPGSIPRSAPYMRIASFTYDARAPSNVQTFGIPQQVRDLGIDFGIVILAIKSNYGSDFTCLYRMRVHGERLAPLPPIFSEESESEVPS